MYTDYVDTTDTIKAKFKGYCAKCQHTFWPGETVRKQGPKGFTHLDCLVALADRTPRTLSPRFETELKQAGLGIPDKGILKKKAKKRILLSQEPGVPPGVGFASSPHMPIRR
jgi:hypothetical protein